MSGTEDYTDPITVLTEEQSYAHLASQQLGRLVVRRKDDMDIFPINYVLDEDNNIYFRTAEGSKLFTVNLNPDVLLEADHVEGDAAWSVVVKGTAELVKDNAEVARADALPLKPWIPTLKYNYVRIAVTSISGRDFRLGDEPERY